MIEFINDHVYRFISRADKKIASPGRAMNAYAASTPASLANVCLYDNTLSDTCQQWIYKETTSGNKYFVCKANTALALDQYTGTSGGTNVINYNAHLYAPSSTSYIIWEYHYDVEEDVDFMKIKLANDQSKYLTANEGARGSSNGSVNAAGNIYWYPSANVTEYSQDWLIEELNEDGTVKPNPPTGPEEGEANSYIMANNWLKLYTNPTVSTGGRTVNIPSVASYTGSDGVQYQFTNKNYWYAYENYSDSKISPTAVSYLTSIGQTPMINVGSQGQYTNEDGRYWMAVGPKVVNPNHGSNQMPYPVDMFGKGVLDIVVKNSSGQKYYIPAVVGDVKGHTWDNGVIQTWKSYPNGAYTSAQSNYNGTVAAEFIGAFGSGWSSGLGQYEIDSIIFYPADENDNENTIQQPIAPPQDIEDVDIMQRYNAPLSFTGSTITINNVEDGESTETYHRGSGFRLSENGYSLSNTQKGTEVIDTIRNFAKTVFNLSSLPSRSTCDYYLFGEYSPGINYHHGVDIDIGYGQNIYAFWGGELTSYGTLGRIQIYVPELDVTTIYLHMENLPNDIEEVMERDGQYIIQAGQRI